MPVYFSHYSQQQRSIATYVCIASCTQQIVNYHSTITNVYLFISTQFFIWVLVIQKTVTSVTYDTRRPSEFTKSMKMFTSVTYMIHVLLSLLRAWRWSRQLHMIHVLLSLLRAWRWSRQLHMIHVLLSLLRAWRWSRQLHMIHVLSLLRAWRWSRQLHMIHDYTSFWVY